MYENLLRVKRGSEQKASIVPISYLDTVKFFFSSDFNIEALVNGQLGAAKNQGNNQCLVECCC